MIVALLLIFIALIIIIGGDRGVMSLMALIGNVIVFFSSVFLMKYYSPFKIIMLDIILMCLLTLIYQNGVNVKTISSLISVLVLTIILMRLSIIIGNYANIGGYNEFEMYEDKLMTLSVNIDISLPSIALSMIVLGVTGALIDIAMAVTSSLYEIWNSNKSADDDSLFRAGMSVGKSILGSTINTLWFACIGESLLMFLLFRKYEYSFTSLINSKAFIQNLITIMISGVGCALTVPMTTFIFVKLLRKWKFEDKE